MDFLRISNRNIVIVAGISAIICAFAATAFGLQGLVVSIGVIVGIFVLYIISIRPWAGIVFIAFTLPFERVASIDVAGFTLRISQVLLLMTLAVVIMHVVFGRMRVRLHGAHIPLLLFAVGAAIALPASINPFRGLTSFAFMLFTAALVLLIPLLIDSKKKLSMALYALLAGAFLTALFGLFQFAGDLAGLPPSITGLRDLYTKEVFGFPRIQSTTLEPLYFANYLLFPIALSLVLLLRKNRTFFYLAAFVLAASLPAFVLTLSRAAYIGLACMALVVAIYCFRNIFSPLRIVLLLFILVVTFFAVNYALSLTGDKEASLATFTRQATGLFIGASYSDRVSTITQATEIIKAHPFGIGPGNFGPYVAVEPRLEPKGGWLIVNNIYIEVLAEEGILGLLGFVAFLVVVLARSGKAAITHADPFLRSVAIAATAAIIGICIQYLTFSVLYIMHIWFAFGVALAAAHHLPDDI